MNVSLLSYSMQFTLEFIMVKSHAVGTDQDLAGREVPVCEEEVTNSHASLTVPVCASSHCRLWQPQQMRGFTSRFALQLVSQRDILCASDAIFLSVTTFLLSLLSR